MLDEFVIAVPYPGLVLRGGGDAAVPVIDIDDCAVVDRRDFDPGDKLTC